MSRPTSKLHRYDLVTSGYQHPSIFANNSSCQTTSTSEVNFNRSGSISRGMVSAPERKAMLATGDPKFILWLRLGDEAKKSGDLVQEALKHREAQELLRKKYNGKSTPESEFAYGYNSAIQHNSAEAEYGSKILGLDFHQIFDPDQSQKNHYVVKPSVQTKYNAYVIQQNKLSYASNATSAQCNYTPNTSTSTCTSREWSDSLSVNDIW